MNPIKTTKQTIKDFMTFLKESSAIALAIAVVSGNAVSSFVSTLVNGIITPAIELVIPKGNYESITITIGNSHFLIGELIGSGIELLIIMWIIFIFAKYITKDEGLLEKAKVKKAKVKMK